VQNDAEVLDLGAERRGDLATELVEVVVRGSKDGKSIMPASSSPEHRGVPRLDPDLPDLIGVFVVAGGDDFLLHLGVPTQTRSTPSSSIASPERPEVADVRTSVVYGHIRRPVLEPLVR
jgi:hypothetical protein